MLVEVNETVGDETTPEERFHLRQRRKETQYISTVFHPLLDGMAPTATVVRVEVYTFYFKTPNGLEKSVHMIDSSVNRCASAFQALTLRSIRQDSIPVHPLHDVRRRSRRKS